MMTCGRCKRWMHPHLLDTVLLDANGSDASEKAYCRRCHPHVRVVDADRWRPLHRNRTLVEQALDWWARTAPKAAESAARQRTAR